MKKLVSLLLAVLLLVPALCAADEADVTWGMSEADFLAAMPQPDYNGSSSTDNYEAVTHVYYNAQVSVYDDASLAYFFVDEKLTGKMYGFREDPDQERYGYLSKALAQKYGEGDSARAVIEEIVSYFGFTFYDEIVSGLAWTAEDGTRIAICHIADMTIIFYLAPEDVAGKRYNDSGL